MTASSSLAWDIPKNHIETSADWFQFISSSSPEPGPGLNAPDALGGSNALDLLQEPKKPSILCLVFT